MPKGRNTSCYINEEHRALYEAVQGVVGVADDEPVGPDRANETVGDDARKKGKLCYDGHFGPLKCPWFHL